MSRSAYSVCLLNAMVCLILESIYVNAQKMRLRELTSFFAPQYFLLELFARHFRFVLEAVRETDVSGCIFSRNRIFAFVSLWICVLWHSFIRTSHARCLPFVRYVCVAMYLFVDLCGAYQVSYFLCIRLRHGDGWLRYITFKIRLFLFRCNWHCFLCSELSPLFCVRSAVQLSGRSEETISWR